eukprot:TRINITY_DN6986_c0_g1_i7.p1 TRINITY_DN6986_c0_g1~~TRINITY_DN6986_c0_g1_i7.p1  ORF type:complete len:184 (+),score=36.48 TRINITY_DN6986_c0_g1_i7:64-615(+)
MCIRDRYMGREMLSRALRFQTKFYVRSTPYARFFSTEQPKPEEAKPRRRELDVKDAEELLRYTIEPKSFFQRNKLTFAFLGAGAICHYLHYEFLLLGFYGLTLANFLRVENIYLNIRKWYEELYGVNDVKYNNLNALLAERMLADPELSIFIRKESLTFSGHNLVRRTHSERHKKSRVRVNIV